MASFESRLTAFVEALPTIEVIFDFSDHRLAVKENGQYVVTATNPDEHSGTVNSDGSGQEHVGEHLSTPSLVSAAAADQDSQTSMPGLRVFKPFDRG